MSDVITLSARDYDAVLFDLDGVLTRTASVHAAAWKKLFDGFLEQRASQSGEPFVPFDIVADYQRYVDGKPRYDGVASFLESRGIELPLGAPEDGPDAQSVRALGKQKDQYFLQHLEQHGVEPYEAAILLVRKLRAQDIKTAVVSSSNNCAAVLEAAGIAQLFDARVDGKDVTRLELTGKPAPDAFMEAARRIGAEPARAVVVEDAIAGVAAGRAGQFGYVIGVDRGGHAQALRDAGAHLKYEFTPLLRTENHFIANLDDASIFFAPSLIYSLTADWEWVLGVQFFRGGAGSEYGRFHDLAYTSLQWFF